MKVVLSDKLEELNYLGNIGEKILNLLHNNEWYSPSLQRFQQASAFPSPSAFN